MIFSSINPYDQSIIAEYQQHESKDLNKILSTAETTFTHWKLTSHVQRAEALQKLAQLLEADKESLARLITAEMGKPLKEAIGEVKKCASLCEYYAEHAEGFLSPKTIETSALHSYVSYEPLGTVLAVMPWNFPFWQALRFGVPAIMAGNVVVLKHAQNVFGCALKIEELFLKAGFPKGTMQAAIIDGDQTAGLVEHPQIKAVTFTGSTKVGAIVAGNAGRHIKKTVLELGGSDPLIILPDADLNKAIEVGFTSRMKNAGQSCIAAKRFIVAASIADDFITAMKAKIDAVKLGDPMLADTDMGPMARPDLVETLHDQISESMIAGADLLIGGKMDGNLYAPSLLTNIAPGMPAFDEETFGPLLAIAIAKNDQEAIALANATTYGLGAALWTQDLEKAKKMIPQLESGNVFVNEMVQSDPRLPFGGVKSSGYGRELSEEGIKEFVNVKTVYIA